MHASIRPIQPPVSSGFEHVNRYWDDVHQVWAAKILPGEFYVSTTGEMVVTVLGSCIAACIRDKVRGIGGMNHFMLPEQNEFSSDVWGGNPGTAASRYGNWAMEFLINEILKRGGRKENLEVKLFGGGQMFAAMSDIGQRNILFAYNYLANEGLKVTAADVGDIYARKVLYFADTGSAKVRRIRDMKNTTLLDREKRYRSQVQKESVQAAGTIDLF
ncbi:chemoreceptor glutamine deamidase CheD [Oceanobacter mangrovi]|uniref:chemoreceptor glutamine deamidase CheD n=1 Tax=Oceanobacter mangrovi TaxID=2862510 RepID=UPI001C8EB99D|nr:chemoreceptor glutamine deamidase CheD [Oceanobacter mangrovi]